MTDESHVLPNGSASAPLNGSAAAPAQNGSHPEAGQQSIAVLKAQQQLHHQQATSSEGAIGDLAAVAANATPAPAVAEPAAPQVTPAPAPNTTSSAPSTTALPNGITPSSSASAITPSTSQAQSLADSPGKRQRKESDDAAFDPNVIIGGDAGEIKLTLAQIKYAQNAVKALKGRTEARAFLAPVDPVALNIPNYRTIVTKPMDLGTVDIKLALTAAAAKGGNKPTEKVKLAPKWGLDLRRDVYTTQEEFAADVRLTFQNCRTFNGPQHLISQSADVLDAVFDKQMKLFPSADAPPETPTEEQPQARFDGLPVDRRLSMDFGRPKREIHPPPPRDIPSDEPQSLKSKKKKKNRASMTPAEAAHWDKVGKEEVKFCGKVVEDLLKPANQDTAWVFYEIPDRSYDFAPAYYAMIKRPVSLTMIQKRLKNGQYADADEVDADMQLLFKNCFTFNQPGSDVAIMGEKLKAVYEKMMSRKPEPSPFVAEMDIDDNEESEASILATALLEQADLFTSHATDLQSNKPSSRALNFAKDTLSALGALPDFAPAPKKESNKRRKSVGNGDAPKKSKKLKKEESGAPKKVNKQKKVKKEQRARSDDEDVRVVTYEQKEELAAKFGDLPPDRVEGALKIIEADKPHSANDDEEIELDIDELSPRTLYKLYRYVVRPKTKKTTNSNPAKSASDGRKRGTGGVKKRNLDEDEESQRIENLKAQLQQFEGGTGAGGQGSQAAGHDDLVASESSGDEDDSDESGSDY